MRYLWYKNHVTELPENILLIDKPSGITSFDVIRQLRKKLGINKMGHAGTLDPLATGLMIIATQKGTKLLSHYLKLPKTYEAEILLGTRTDSGDITGKIIETKPVTPIDPQEITAVAATLVGTHTLSVPTYSAIKVDGVRLYKRAHRGEQDIQTPKKEMVVTRMEIQNVTYHNDACTISCVIDVASGTYIRSIAEELGKRLGYPATIQELRRTRIGPFDIQDAVAL